VEITLRAIDNDGNTVDYLLTAKRDRKAATRFLCKAIKLNDDPIKININKRGANTAAINDYNDDEGTDIEICQNKYLYNTIEQPIKQLCRATLGFKSFKSAKITTGGFESMRFESGIQGVLAKNLGLIDTAWNSLTQRISILRRRQLHSRCPVTNLVLVR
jgi:putative transposase